MSLMLIQFSVENFLSIKGKVVLSLLASKDNEHPNHLIADETNRYLKSAVIYGANASGKSNVLNAFCFMVNYVLTSHNQQIHKAIDRSPFKFDPETPTHPSSFEVIFTTKGIRYAYGFSVTDRAVTEEYLYFCNSPICYRKAVRISNILGGKDDLKTAGARGCFRIKFEG